MQEQDVGSATGTNTARSSPFEDCEALLATATDNAYYGQHPGTHFETSQIPAPVLSATDAIVLESGVDRYEALELEELYHHDQYASIVRQNLADGKKSMFFVDVPFKHAEWYVHTVEIGMKIGVPCAAGVLGAMRGRPELAALMVPALSFCAAGQRWKRFASKLQLCNAYNSFGLRSAITAKKLEEFVAPYVGKDLDHAPRLLVDYGSGHLDISTYVERPSLRKRVMQFNKLLRNHHIDTDYLSRVCEFRFQSFQGEPQESTLDGKDMRYEKIIHDI